MICPPVNAPRGHLSWPTAAGRRSGLRSGRYDGIASVINGQAIADRIRNAELRVYDGGHLFLVQDPAAWPDLVAFLTD